MGSSDRRAVSALCHGWLRLGQSVSGPPDADTLLAGTYLTAGLLPDVAALRPQWSLTSPSAADLGIDPTQIFPFPEALSQQVPAPDFSAAHLRQPDLFLRLRPGREAGVRAALNEKHISFRSAGDSVLRLPTGIKLEEVGGIDRDYVVQDLSSTETLDLLEGAELGDRFSAWDCCAASGGKSLLLRDRYPQCSLTVTDIRKSVLHNLADRFQRACLRNYRSFVVDLAKPGGVPVDFGPFDLVLCDAPCSGSGTWGRTPEWLRYFRADRIGHYASLQRHILLGASERLRPGAYLLYITCSVFSAENEDTVAYAEEQLGLRCLSQRYHAGWQRDSDTLFSALLIAQS